MAGKTIAYISTAANGEGNFNVWSDGESWQVVQNLGATVTPLELERHSADSVKDALTGKDIIWFAGGMSGYLMYWTRRRKVDLLLPKLLSAGSLYVGSSAGSMITGKTLDVSEWYIGEEEVGASCIPGLGLVDFDFYQHYEEQNLEEIKKLYKGEKLYLVKDGEVILVEDGNVKVLGEERIITN